MDKGRQGGSLADLRKANRREAVRALRRPGGLTQAESEAVFKKDYQSFAAAIKAAGIAPPQ